MVGAFQDNVSLANLGAPAQVVRYMSGEMAKSSRHISQKSCAQFQFVASGLGW